MPLVEYDTTQPHPVKTLMTVGDDALPTTCCRNLPWKWIAAAAIAYLLIR